MTLNFIKNKVVIFIFLKIFILQFLSAQECSYAEYYQLADLARQSYSKKNYKEAKIHYKLAFSKIDFPHGQDLSFALVTANKVKDDEWAISVAEKLAKGGVPLRYFSQFKNSNWYTTFYSNFDKYLDYYNANFDKCFNQELITLINKDSDFIDTYHKWRTHKIEMSITEMVEAYEKIFTDFEKLVDKYGFPNEKLLGYNYVQRKNIIEPYEINALIIHIYQFGVVYLEEDIPKIVCEGGLPFNFEKLIVKIRGFGNSTGIEQEMKARYIKFRGQNEK